jgi:hypothetical protein
MKLPKVYDAVLSCRNIRCNDVTAMKSSQLIHYDRIEWVSVSETVSTSKISGWCDEWMPYRSALRQGPQSLRAQCMY